MQHGATLWSLAQVVDVRTDWQRPYVMLASGKVIAADGGILVPTQALDNRLLSDLRRTPRSPPYAPGEDPCLVRAVSRSFWVPHHGTGHGPLAPHDICTSMPSTMVRTSPSSPGSHPQSSSASSRRQTVIRGVRLTSYR
ncbi:hypothetical protein C8Q80DRAFT_1212545 [Daedaleopsis nitida]|nr:hypothetical protein C8Q80DRAFT_1212545 [Daedaleopsis nitida]